MVNLSSSDVNVPLLSGTDKHSVPQQSLWSPAAVTTGADVQLSVDAESRAGADFRGDEGVDRAVPPSARAMTR